MKSNRSAHAQSCSKSSSRRPVTRIARRPDARSLPSAARVASVIRPPKDERVVVIGREREITHTLSLDALRERAWRAVELHYVARLAGLVEIFGTARARALGSDDLDAIAESAAAGRVATLLVQAEREKADIDDRLDDIAETTLRHRGQVVVVPVVRMPTGSGAAAIYRF